MPSPARLTGSLATFAKLAALAAGLLAGIVNAAEPPLRGAWKLVLEEESDGDDVRAYQRPEGKAPPSTDDLDFAKLIQPAPRSAKLVDDNHFTWGGSMVEGADGKFHLFYSRWPHKTGFGSWVSHSEVAHAVADKPLGPYRFVDVALPARGRQHWDGLCTHNPTVLAHGGKFHLYYMGNTGDGKVTKGLNWSHRNNQRIGVAVADSPAGPWKRSDKPLIDASADPGAPDALMTSNPSVAIRPDGGVLMVYKAVGKQRKMPFGGPVVHLVANAPDPAGPFTKHPDPVFTAADNDFPAEDPFIWYDHGRLRYYAIVKDMKGSFTGIEGRSLALFTSLNGIDWKPARHPLVSPTTVKWSDGEEKFSYLERPQVWLKSGVPTALFLAARHNNEQSINVHLPLNEGK